jgi:hypothetical protein
MPRIQSPTAHQLEKAAHWLSQRSCGDCLAVAQWLTEHGEIKRSREEVTASALAIRRGQERAKGEGRSWPSE